MQPTRQLAMITKYFTTVSVKYNPLVAACTSPRSLPPYTCVYIKPLTCLS